MPAGKTHTHAHTQIQRAFFQRVCVTTNVRRRRQKKTACVYVRPNKSQKKPKRIKLAIYLTIISSSPRGYDTYVFFHGTPNLTTCPYARGTGTNFCTRNPKIYIYIYKIHAIFLLPFSIPLNTSQCQFSSLSLPHIRTFVKSTRLVLSTIMTCL